MSHKQNDQYYESKKETEEDKGVNKKKKHIASKMGFKTKMVKHKEGGYSTMLGK